MNLKGILIISALVTLMEWILEVFGGVDPVEAMISDSIGFVILLIVIVVIALLVDTVSPGWENAPWTKKMWISVILSPIMGVMSGIEGGVLAYAIMIAAAFLMLFMVGTSIGVLLDWFFTNWWVKS